MHLLALFSVKHQCMVMVMKYLTLINVQHVKVTNAYNNTKEKLHRTNVAMWFNKICKILSSWFRAS